MAIKAGLQKAKVLNSELPAPQILANYDRVDQVSVIEKSITDNVATLRVLENPHYHVGLKVVVSGIMVDNESQELDARFNGEYIVTDVGNMNGTDPDPDVPTDPYRFSYATASGDVALQENIVLGTVAKKKVLSYLSRYQILSQDQNEFSSWSPIYSIPVPYWIKRPIGISSVTGVQVAGVFGSMVISWEPVSLMLKDKEIRKAPSYDVWISWGRTDEASGQERAWEYVERVFSNSVSVIIPETAPSVPAYDKIAVEIRLSANPASRDDEGLILVYKTNGWLIG